MTQHHEKEHHENEASHDKKIKPNYYRIAMVVLLVLVVALVVFKYTGTDASSGSNQTQDAKNVSTSLVKKNVSTTSSSTEQKTCVVQEPYEVSEEYQAKEPYGKKTCAQRPLEFTTKALPREVGSNNTITCRLEVTNTDVASGEWYFGAYYDQEQGRVQRADSKKTIPANSSVIYEWQMEVTNVNFADNCVMYVAGTPSTEKCFYAEPVTYKVINKLRTVTKYKNVTKAC